MATEGIDLKTAIESLRNSLLEARASGANADIQLPIASMTVRLDVSATVDTEGNASFRVPIIDVGVGGHRRRQQMTGQSVEIVFREPVDREGRPIQVSSSTDRREE